MQTPELTEELVLTATQEKAIAALIPHNTSKEAAAAAEVGEVSLWRWLKQKHFHKAYMHARWKAVAQSIARIQHSTANAAALLDKMVNDEKEQSWIRISAARTILYNARKAIELEDHEGRLRDSENAIDAKSD